MKSEDLCRLYSEPAACEAHFAALPSDSEPLCVSSCSLPPRDTYRPWHPFWKSTRTHTHSQLLLISSHHLTPLLHLGLPDMAFSVTLDQVGSLLSTNCSQTTELFYFLLLRIKLYEDCQHLFDSALRRSGTQHEWFQHVLKCPIIHREQSSAT